MNDEFQGEFKLVKWIVTEAQTGRGRLDTHFSYVNIVLPSYVENGFDKNLEDDIANTIAHRGGIACTFFVLVNASKFKGQALYETFKGCRTGNRSTHEVQW